MHVERRGTAIGQNCPVRGTGWAASWPPKAASEAAASISRRGRAMRAGLGEGGIVCSRGGRHLFWFRGVCATAASCRCLAGRSDRRRPPLCPWDRGDGGRPQRVSSEARPAKRSHNFRAPTRREHRRAQGIWAGIDAAARPSGRRQLLRASRRRSEARAAGGGSGGISQRFWCCYATTGHQAELSSGKSSRRLQSCRPWAPDTVVCWKRR